MYHSISNQASPRFRRFTLAPELFTEHLRYLKEHDYTSLTVTQLVRIFTEDSRKLPERPVVLTFDDGFADFYTHALPALKRYDFTATLYIATGFVGATSGWLKREGEATRPMLNWSQLAEISANGIECGGHSHSHPQLDILPLDIAHLEITQCKNILEERLGREVLSFAYPFGFYTTSIRRSVQAANYTSACAIKREMSLTGDDPFTLSRLEVQANTSLENLAALLTSRSSVATKLLKEARESIWHALRRRGIRLRTYCQPSRVGEKLF